MRLFIAIYKESSLNFTAATLRQILTREYKRVASTTLQAGYCRGARIHRASISTQISNWLDLYSFELDSNWRWQAHCSHPRFGRKAPGGAACRGRSGSCRPTSFSRAAAPRTGPPSGAAPGVQISWTRPPARGDALPLLGYVTGGAWPDRGWVACRRSRARARAQHGDPRPRECRGEAAGDKT